MLSLARRLADSRGAAPCLCCDPVCGGHSCGRRYVLLYRSLHRPLHRLRAGDLDLARWALQPGKRRRKANVCTSSRPRIIQRPAPLRLGQSHRRPVRRNRRHRRQRTARIADIYRQHDARHHRSSSARHHRLLDLLARIRPRPGPGAYRSVCRHHVLFRLRRRHRRIFRPLSPQAFDARRHPQELWAVAGRPGNI